MDKPSIRILVVDDHAVTRLGIVSLLETEDDFRVVGQAEDGETAVREARRTHPDIVVMDLMMPKMDGFEATRQILQDLPQTKILILTTFGGADSIAHTLEAGATGAIMKSTDTAAFPDVIRKIAAGQRIVDPEIAKLMNEHPPIPTLTERQQEILMSVMRGLTNKDIAQLLGITTESIKDHIRAIFAKIGAANRAEAVSIALRRHLLKI